RVFDAAASHLEAGADDGSVVLARTAAEQQEAAGVVGALAEQGFLPAQAAGCRCAACSDEQQFQTSVAEARQATVLALAVAQLDPVVDLGKAGAQRGAVGQGASIGEVVAEAAGQGHACPVAAARLPGAAAQQRGIPI